MSDPIEPDRYTLQLAREKSSMDDGALRARLRNLEAARAGRPTNLEQVTLSLVLPQAAKFLRDAMDGYRAEPRGGKPLWWAYLNKTDPDALAVAALREAFAAAQDLQPLAGALRRSGSAAEVVWGYDAALRKAAEAPKRVRRLNLKIKTGGTEWQRRKMILREAGEEAWTDELRASAGGLLMSAALATGLFEMIQDGKRSAKGFPIEVLGLSSEGLELAKEVAELGIWTQPRRRPMIHPPRPWTSLNAGGYLTPEAQTPLVNTQTARQKKLLQAALKDGSLQPVLDAVNQAQDTPYRVRKSILSLRHWTWSLPDADTPFLAPRESVEVPLVPPPGAGSPQDRRRLWGLRKRALRINRGLGPNQLAWGATTQELDELAEEERFWLPMSMDFRGRLYPIPATSHQSSDETKACIEFADGRPLGPDGMHWLAIHLANCGDFDKVSKRPFSAREQWVWDNADLIQRVADDPCGNLEWLKADAPFSFVAACQEYVAALDSGDPTSFVSHLPVSLDGSNSGVQHYSLLMRAEEARLVSLGAADAPADLYQTVADAVALVCAKAASLVAKRWAGVDVRALADTWAEEVRAFQEAYTDPETGSLRLDPPGKRTLSRLKSKRDFANVVLWHHHGITRSLVKRPVMTFGYSASAFGFSQQIREDYMEPFLLQVLKGTLAEHPFGQNEGRVAASVMGRLVYAQVRKTLPHVSAAMEWLRTVALRLAAVQEGVLIQAPDGFPMFLRVTEQPVKKVSLHLLDRSITVMEMTSRDRAVGETVLRWRRAMMVMPSTQRTVVAHKQGSGVAPNAIHTLDAAHLRAVVRGLATRGVTATVLIHDSFGVHAGVVGVLREVLRATLVAQYSGEDVLEGLRKWATEGHPEVALPISPVKGKFPLKEVLRADYPFA